MTSIIILVAVLLCVYAIDDNEVLEQWRNFQIEFGKIYRSPAEINKRLFIFKKSLETIEAHNSLFENNLVSYALGVNQFADWTQEEFKQYVNKGIAMEKFNSQKAFTKTEGFIAPESVDWREQNVVTPVKNQGSCGSCWTFSTTGAIEGQLGIVKNNLTSLSEQNLVDCSKYGNNNGCDGGLMTLAFDYVEETGIVSEDDYPYTGKEGTCRADEFAYVTKISSYVNIPEGDEEALTEAIATQGPVSVGICGGTLAFQLYSHGVFSDFFCSSVHLNHGVLAVGYGSEDGKDYYIVKNSWGDKWGENSYVRMARNDKNMCGIATLASYPKL